MLRRMFSSQQQQQQRYQPVRTAESAASSTLETHQPIPYPGDEDDSEADDVLSLDSIDDQEAILRSASSSKLRRRQSRLSCSCLRLSRTAILASALIIAIIAILLGLGGLHIYKTGPPDGQSPPWYPAPKGGTSQSWQASYDKAKIMVEKMTLVEKVNITTGVGWSMGLCVGNTGAANSVGFPSLCLQDGPLGLRFADLITAFPAGITVGATWNRALMRLRGKALGAESRMKGVHVLLGPAMGPLGRHPAGGRIWEGFGADPVLQGVAASETIRGIQSAGVIATAKHWVGNEQEHFRRPLEWGLPHALSANIDDRTLHEIYAWPFAESVRAGVASVMCSYQMVNNSYACGNSKLMNGILKDELGFQGFVQSDWRAQQSGVGSALSGLDMTMPGDGLGWADGNSLWGPQLSIGVLNGSVPLDRLNDMATRIVAAWYQLGQDAWGDIDTPNFSSWTHEKIGKLHQGASNSDEEGVVNQFIDVRADHGRLARQVAAEGAVLVKNEGNVLPLNRSITRRDGSPFRVMIIGEDAGPSEGPNQCVDRACNKGTLAVGWGSGASDFSYLVDPASAISKAFKSAEISTHLSNDVDSSVQTQLKKQDLCIVFANADSGEGYLSWSGIHGDRNDLYLQKHGDRLIKQVAESCNNTVAVIHAVGPVIVEGWADLTSVKAILLANLPGQESGNALVDVLFGDVDASGRLPYTVGRALEDYGPGAGVLYYPNAVVPQADFDEGLYVDYRHFDKSGIEPRYPFGYGLSYTTFDISEIHLTKLKSKSPLPAARVEGLSPPEYGSTLPNPSSALFPSGFRKLNKYIYPYITSVDKVKPGAYPYPIGYDTPQIPSAAGGAEGGNPSLFEDYVHLNVRVANTGKRTGNAVVQVYVSFPEDTVEASTGEKIDFPVRVLRNFEKVELLAGESQVVGMNLTRKDLSYWSVVQQNWVMPPGEFSIAVGSSSRDLPLTGSY